MNFSEKSSALLRREHRLGIEHGLQLALAGDVVRSQLLLAQGFGGCAIHLRRGQQLHHLLVKRPAALVLGAQVVAGLLEDLAQLRLLLRAGADGIEQGRAKRSAQNRTATEPAPLADESGAQK